MVSTQVPSTSPIPNWSGLGSAAMQVGQAYGLVWFKGGGEWQALATFRRMRVRGKWRVFCVGISGGFP